LAESALIADPTDISVDWFHRESGPKAESVAVDRLGDLVDWVYDANRTVW